MNNIFKNFYIISLLFVISCSSYKKNLLNKANQQPSASDRLNQSQSNAENLFE